MYNFINVKDVAQAVSNVINKLKISKNKIYIVSDDCKQIKVYEKYIKLYNKKIITIFLPFILIYFFIRNIPLPKKIFNFLLAISTKVTYNNDKIKKELSFSPKFLLTREILKLND